MDTEMRDGVTVLRLALGSVWLAHGLSTVLVSGLAASVHSLQALGMAGALAYPMVLAQLAGGLAILCGIYPRHVAMILLPLLAGALGVHLGHGWQFSNAGGGWEYPAFLIAASMAYSMVERR